MKKTDILTLHKDISEFKDKEIIIAGWVKSCRGNGNFGFLDVNDGTSFKGLQVVFTKEDLPNNDIV